MKYIVKNSIEIGALFLFFSLGASWIIEAIAKL